MSDPDVLVAGGGPAGSAVALELARLGVDVTLVEAGDYRRFRVGETLPPSVSPLLGRLGIGDAFRALDPLPSHGVRSAWGGPAPATRSHLSSPHGPGWHVDRRALDRLLARSAARAGARLVTATRVAGCRPDGPHAWRVHLDGAAGPGHVRCRVLVDATGRSASVARLLGATRRLLDHLVGSVVRLEAPRGEPRGALLLEARRDVWWYSAPVPGGRRVAVAFTDADVAARLELHTPAGWGQALRDAPLTRARLAASDPLGPPELFAAVSQRLRRSARADAEGRAPWLAVGAAAAAVDPLSGRGVEGALRDGVRAAGRVRTLLEGGPPGLVLREHRLELAQGWRTYLRERRATYGLERRWPDAPLWSRRSPSSRPDASPRPRRPALARA